MPKFVVSVVFQVTAKDAVEALEKAHAGLPKKHVAIVADSLDTMPHPVHLAAAQELVGYKKVEDGG